MNKLVYEKTAYTFDIDFAGHVNNAVYLRWLEVGRTKLLEAIGLPLETVKQKGFYPVLTHTEIHYKKPVFISETVRIELWVSHVTKIRALLEFRIYNPKGEVVVTAKQGGAFISLETGRPHRLTEEERSMFETYLNEKEEEES